MGFIKLNRYGDPSGTVFEPEDVLNQLRLVFPEMRRLAGDQLAINADQAAAQGTAEHVVQTLRRNQQAYGPAYAFEIPLEEGHAITGRARKFDVTFLFADPLNEDWRRRLLGFLQTLGPGKLESAPDRKSAEVPTKV